MREGPREGLHVRLYEALCIWVQAPEMQRRQKPLLIVSYFVWLMCAELRSSARTACHLPGPHLTTTSSFLGNAGGQTQNSAHVDKSLPWSSTPLVIHSVSLEWEKPCFFCLNILELQYVLWSEKSSEKIHPFAFVYNNLFWNEMAYDSLCSKLHIAHAIALQE